MSDTPTPNTPSTSKHTPESVPPSLLRKLAKPLGIGLGIVLLAVGYFMFSGNTLSYEGVRGAKIKPGSGFDGVLRGLRDAGIIQNETTFKILATVTGARRSFKGGYYEFKSGASNWNMISRIKNGEQTPIKITLLPGWRPKKVAEVLEKKLEIPPAEFYAALKDEAFAAQLNTTPSYLFGYLMPETYNVYWGTKVRPLLRRIKAEFMARITEDMKAKMKARNLTLDQVISLAGIVEWEARKDAEKQRIAGVYSNRLRDGMLLQADPTVQYALMETDGGIMRRLLYRDYTFPHPYNTYIHPGLPPGAITNPSFNAVKASISPETHDYYYFVADGTGGHLFSRSLSEHNARAADYQAMMRVRRAEQRREAEQNQNKGTNPTQ